jgi:hypothetical protein
MNLMFGVGWIELILVVAVLIFIVIMYQVYWIQKRNLAVGFTFLIIACIFSICTGIGGFYVLYLRIANGWVSFSIFSNILAFIASMAWGLFWTGLGIYGLISVYRNLRTVFGVLRKRRTKVD